MFSKSHYQPFIHYHHLNDSTRWDRDFQTLVAHGIRYLILSRGLDLKTILTDEDQKQWLMQFLDTADAHRLRCILSPGNPRELYLQPDARRWRMDYIKHVSEAVGDHPAVYALLLEEHPTGGAHIGIDRWKPVTAEMEGRLESRTFTEDGYQHAIRLWQMEEYAKYIKDQVAVVKKSRSHLKTTVCFHIDALFPRKMLVDFQAVASALDFVMIDTTCDWQGDPDECRYLPRFAASVASSLTDKDVWALVGAHVEQSRYQASLHEMREWTQQTMRQRVNGIGWSGWDASFWDDRYAIRGMPLSERDPERWAAILALSRSASVQERRDGDASPAYACLLAYDALINGLSYQDFFAPNVVLGEYCGLSLSYVTDRQLIAKNALQKRRMLFATPCPSIHGDVVERMIAFMKNGGWVIAAADDGALDEQMRPSDARHRLFGIQQETAIGHDDRILLEPDLARLPAGASLPAAWRRARIQAIDDHVRVLGRWGDHAPAMLLTPHEKGGALYIATNPYRAAMAADNDDWLRFFESVSDPDALKRLCTDKIKMDSRFCGNDHIKARS